MAHRACFRAPIPEIFECANLLREAVDRHLEGNNASASALFSQANNSLVREWLDSIWGKKSLYIDYRPVPNSPPVLKKVQRLETRMPSSAEKAALLHRDGFHCRLCGIPVIRSEVRKYLHALYPNDVPAGRTNASQHAAFQAMWVQYDHILPHARGGTNAEENMLITCTACNFGRMEFTLDEVGIKDPRCRPAMKSSWCGLDTFFLKQNESASQTKNPTPTLATT